MMALGFVSNVRLFPFGTLNNKKFNQYINNSNENVVKCKYYILEEVQTMKISYKKTYLSLFLINTCSSSKNF